jgi:ABC-2 type transport system ATP-binding protein
VATALVGNPDLLFLDEPTTGLDPQARRQLWDIIRGFRRQGRTVLLTTHYMDEAERLCDRVAIVDRGKVIALGSPAELIASLGGEHIVNFSVLDSAEAPELHAEQFATLPGVHSVRRDAEQISLGVAEPHVTLPALLERVKALRLDLASLNIRHASLEDVFVNLTGRHLRDGESSAS